MVYWGFSRMSLLVMARIISLTRCRNVLIGLRKLYKDYPSFVAEPLARATLLFSKMQ